MPATTSKAPGAIDFYFDFMSPFAYIAYQKLPEIAAKHQRPVRYRAINLAVVKKAAGNIGPSNRDIPPKFAYLKRDLARWASIYDAPFAFPDPSCAVAGSRDATLAQRGVFFAKQRGREQEYITTFWRATWGSGRFVGDADILRQAVVEVGLPLAEFLEYIHSDEAERLYRAATDAAIMAGVFGVPTMICDGEMWWGNDRLGMLDSHLEASGAIAALG